MPRLKIVVGGSAKGVGKTSLVCGLIAATPEFAWTAVKIASHPHNGVDLVLEDMGVNTDDNRDTYRYLRAGAERAFLVTAEEANVPTRLIWSVLRTAPNILIETTRFASEFKPDICIGVLGNSTTPVKESFGSFLPRADALVARVGQDVRLDKIPVGIPLFRLAELDQISPEMLAWLLRKSERRPRGMAR
jgi:hypothetical protein